MSGAPSRARGPWSRVRTLFVRGIVTAAPLWPYYLLLYAVGIAHLAQVHLLDPAATTWVRGALGSDLVLFAPLEAPLYESLDVLWTSERVAGVSAYYLLGFVGLLFWTPHVVAAAGDRGRLTRVLLTYPLIYLLGLPGYLLLPQVNPYVALELADPFSPLHGSLEGTYYLFTTPNNTFPSLHVAFTVALTAHLIRSGSDLVGGAAAVHGVLLIASVVYLRVHWIGDVVGGVLAGYAAVVLADQAARGRGLLGGVVRWLDRRGQRGVYWARRRLRRRD